MIKLNMIAGWSSLVARRAHNPKVGGSNPSPATTQDGSVFLPVRFLIFLELVVFSFSLIRIHSLDLYSLFPYFCIKIINENNK